MSPKAGSPGAKFVKPTSSPFMYVSASLPWSNSKPETNHTNACGLWSWVFASAAILCLSNLRPFHTKASAQKFQGTPFFLHWVIAPKRLALWPTRVGIAAHFVRYQCLGVKTLPVLSLTQPQKFHEVSGQLVSLQNRSQFILQPLLFFEEIKPQQRHSCRESKTMWVVKIKDQTSVCRKEKTSGKPVAQCGNHFSLPICHLYNAEKWKCDTCIVDTCPSFMGRFSAAHHAGSLAGHWPLFLQKETASSRSIKALYTAYLTALYRRMYPASGKHNVLFFASSEIPETSRNQIQNYPLSLFLHWDIWSSLTENWQDSDRWLNLKILHNQKN